MIYNIKEYSEKFSFGGKKLSSMSIRRRCINDQLPSNHKARKLKGKTGQWIIEIKDIDDKR